MVVRGVDSTGMVAPMKYKKVSLLPVFQYSIVPYSGKTLKLKKSISYFH